MSTSLYDISKATGFSVSTVSRVLSNSDYPVRDTTRESILEAAHEMGYQPNLAARSLRTDKSEIIGIVADDILSPFVPPIVRGIQDALREHGFSSLLVNSDWDAEREQAAVDSLLSRRVDGIIFAECSHYYQHEGLTESRMPHVFVHRLFGTPLKNSVVPDDEYGARLAVRHLVELGHRRIGFVTGPPTWHNAISRQEGYQAELAAHGLAYDASLVQPGDWEFESGYASGGALLNLSDPPTAIFAANDLMALGVIYAVIDAGRRVPDDVAVVGYDNRDFTQVFRPRLSTVNMPVYTMGQKAAEILVRQIGGAGPVDEVKVRGEILIRETCGAQIRPQRGEQATETVHRRRTLRGSQPVLP